MSSPSEIADSRRALFIVLEGVDGSGKTTQARLLAEWYREQGYAVVLTREPGGHNTVLAERLRALILDPTIACTPRAELLMLLAARAQHVAETIAPALAAGQMVISDRFSLSTLVYQGFVRGLSLDEIRTTNAIATGGVQPTLTLVIDVPLDVALSRIGERQDRFEGEGRAFLQRVVEGYRCLSEEDPTIHLIDGARPVADIQHDVRRAVQSLQYQGDNT
jgi:dTMP kinase